MRSDPLSSAQTRCRRTPLAYPCQHYRPYTDEVMPQVHNRGLLLGHDDEPIGIVEVTEVRVLPAGQVDPEFARDEGEGFASVADWRAAHERFWSEQGHVITDDTLVVCERFRLVERL